MIEVKSRIFTGTPASPGAAIGRVKMITEAEHLNEVRQGDILVVACASPQFTPAVLQASAVITGSGGMLCSLATISRELGIPCVVSVKEAISALSDDMVAFVNGDEGIVASLAEPNLPVSESI
jgi:phosphoenolpyruvate synthase/pyruvate phosphate dikinase